MEDLETKVILDTDIIIDHLKRKPETTATRIFHEIKTEKLVAHTTSITIFELYRGARLAPKPEEKVGHIEAILNYVDCLPLDETAANVASDICVFLEKKGELIEIRDLFIGAITKNAGLPLVTKNIAHFERIPGLEVITPHDLMKIL